MLIDDYISGRLDDVGYLEFQSRIKTDARFAREVKLRKEIYSTIGNDNKMALLKTLNNIRIKKSNRILKINIFSKQLQAFAASIIVLIIVGAALLSNHIIDSSQLSNIEIYNSYLVEEGSLLSTRSDVSKSNTLVKTGISLYNDRKYSEVITLFNSYPENIIARLYTGFSYMKLEQFNMAEKQFKYIINHSDNIFIDQAEWNLGLSYLANNKTKQASIIFAKIATEDGAYNAPAKDIIKELKNK